MASRIYNTHNGLKSIRNMRYELALVTGDQHWQNVQFHEDAEVMDKYAAVHGDKFASANEGWVEQVEF